MATRRAAPPFSLTKTWHKNTYDSINPRIRKELQLRGKTVVISGGGAGIGRGITKAFVEAGVSRIAILGRRGAKLVETRREVEDVRKEVEVKVKEYVVDVCDLQALRGVAHEIGSWDVLVANAGYMNEPKPLVEADPGDWWRAFEVNVRGVFNLAHSFLPRRKESATLIGVSAGSIQIDAMSKNFSAYNSSKFAEVKLLEILAAENLDLHVVTMHPGVVSTEMAVKSSRGKKRGPPVEFDDVELPSHFAVWLCSEEAKFLGGKFVWCNWDVEELVKKSALIESPSLMLTANCIGWPYSAE